MSFEYDAVGNLEKRTDYLGRETEYTYDNLDRLTQIEYLPNGVGASTFSNYGYDDISRLTSAANSAGTVTFAYDNRNRVTSTTDVYAHTIDYEYERTSTVNQRRLKFDGTMYAVYNFDDADRLANVINSSDSSTITFGYDSEDKLTSRAYPNGITTSYEYFDNDLLKRIVDSTFSSDLLDRQYSYNTAGQISQIVEPTRTRTFGYDNADRVTGVTDATYGNESYLFDDVGNRTFSHLSTTYGYQAGQFNRLSSTDTASYLFDTNGNTVQKNQGPDTWQYSWNHENQMTSATLGTDAAEYTYDALGRRVRRHVAGAQDTKFIHDGHDVLVDDDGGTLTKYLNGPGIDNKLRVQQGTSVNYFLADHLGSTNALADASGTISSQTDYDSFGNQTGSLTTRYGFTGRERDDFTGLMYYRARFYDPQLGRFASEDPIGFAGGDINLYGYVHNNAANKTDPFGLIDPIVYQDPRIYGSYQPTEEEFDIVQNFLVRGGMFPVIGEACDLADGVISYARGDYIGAAYSAGALLPIGGQVFGLLKQARNAKKYAKSRPPYAPGQIDNVWDAAKTPDGRVFDPISGEELFWDKTKPRNGQWDMGHKEDMQYKDYHRKYLDGEISLEEFKKIHRDASNYEPQSVKTNRGRRRRL